MEIVADLVQCLLGEDDEAAERYQPYHLQAERARSAFDGGTALSAVPELLQELELEPNDLRRLETLLILALSFPKVLDRHRERVLEAGRHLALLLEREERVERAQLLLEVLANRLPEERSLQHDLASLMRRSGNTDKLVGRYLRHAEVAIERKAEDEAIAWLQEALMVDRSRRDVARMISDLRYQQADRRKRRRRAGHLTLVCLMVAASVSGVVWREATLDRDYGAIAPAAEGDLVALRARMGRIDDFIAGNPLWIGVFRAQRERARLRTQIDVLEARQAERERKQLERVEADFSRAQLLRTQARESVRRGNYRTALEEFRQALEVAPEGWELFEQTLADVAAIEEFLDEREGGIGPSTESDR